MMRWSLLGWVLGGSVVFFLAGCSAYHERAQAYRDAYAKGRTDIALEKIEALYEDEGAEEEDYNALLLSLEAGTTSREEGLRLNDETLLKKSQDYFARVDKLYNSYQQKGGASIFDYTTSTLTVADAFPYLGTYSEAIMSSLYQMLNAMQMGDIESARLFAARLYQRQKESVSAQSEYITEDREEMAEKASSEQAKQAETYASQMATMTESMRAELPDTRGYEVYVNPFAEFLIAFFHYYYGQGVEDLDVAQQCMRRVLGMQPSSKVLADEVERFSNVKPREVEPTVYLIHASGLVPFMESRTFMLPIIAADTVTMATLAYPVLKSDANACREASLETAQGMALAEEICDMDAVVAKEFDHSYAGRLTHAITICVTKTALVVGAQLAARDNAFALVGTMVAGNLYTLATNVADTRTCYSFPKAFSVARTTLPKDRKVKVYLDGALKKEVQLPTDGKVWVIYMRSFHQGAAPILSTFKVR